ncbi:uncharacterized protein LOC135480711 [Liolophura sinensis]|uniref:uncharacterized protein LOC135480469 n=1 Tax=Liolophura sinensis TaxID=3198878 RepID=UPI00315980BD
MSAKVSTYLYKMTGLKMADKIKLDKVYNQEDCTPARGEHKRSAFALIAALSTALVLGAVFAGVIFHLQAEKSSANQEWISWKRLHGNIATHESVVINVKERTILMVSAEAYRLNAQNSLALHDFKVGYVALREFKRNRCFVTKVSHPDFEAVKTTVEARQGRDLAPQKVKLARLRPGNMTSSELGPTLSQFCAGVPAVWFDLTDDTGITKRRADDQQSHERLNCVYYEIDLPFWDSSVD